MLCLSGGAGMSALGKLAVRRIAGKRQLGPKAGRSLRLTSLMNKGSVLEGVSRPLNGGNVGDSSLGAQPLGEHHGGMFRRKNLSASLDGLEIGATGPNQLQFVVSAEGRQVTVRLRAGEARWLATALLHWADDSETIPAVKPAT
jgi:hypothetical protein